MALQLARGAPAGRCGCSSRLAQRGPCPSPRPLSRRPCKPVAFKERSDDIDAPPPSASTRPTGDSPANPSAAAYGREPLVDSTANLRSVNLGPMATLMYPLLTYGTAAAAAAATVLPGPVGSALFPGATLAAPQRLLLVLTGAALLPTVAAKHEIKRAADSGIVGAPAFKQLASACLMHGVLALVVLTQAVSLRNPVLAASVGALSGLATITTSYTLMKIRESGQVLPSTRGLLGGVLDLISPRNLNATAYFAATVLTMALGGSFFLTEPGSACPFGLTAARGAVDVFCMRMAGAATLANGLVLGLVKQAADAGRAGSPLYQALNVGLALGAGISAIAMLAAVATKHAAGAGPTWAYAGLMGAVAVLAGANKITAPPPAVQAAGGNGAGGAAF
ncbi:hypothetical protein HYH03_015625 [Edaphochlamys debaryana]|uniref:Uncharacterized protein n=1 Tax=Edaphochlamys debaryana TaxID=47281 RepID=A0A836BSE1_9CHLO|nr:hypothetical protein HYH03_015625 [Edaphochlamys debaryana]|eukprot:KAG2485653.1 hypothetical protein HYH03_015625 [Edaphochlamys debaryana]